MKASILLLSAATAVLAHPGGMGLRTLMQDLTKRQAANTTVEMIGDLIQGATTPVGEHIRDCLLGVAGTCQDLSAKTYTPPGELGSSACAQDTCCVWDFVAKDLVELFTEADGTCNSFARASVRLGFHDAGAWSKTSDFGGADGSLILTEGEILQGENSGLAVIRTAARGILNTYAPFGVGAADLVQFMHNVATVVCPLGPRQITFVGRVDNNAVNPRLLPDTRASADSLIQLFAEKTMTVIDLISLIGAHTTATQSFVDPAKAGQPLDSTPGVWDVEFYKECLAGAPPSGVFRLPSDDAFVANNASTRGFTVFSDPATGQAAWNALYAKAYTRLSLLGVNRINQLTDCTKVLPSVKNTVPPSNNTSSSSSSALPSSTSSALSSSVSDSSSSVSASATSSSTESGSASVSTTSSSGSASGNPTASTTSSSGGASGNPTASGSSSSSIGISATLSSGSASGNPTASITSSSGGVSRNPTATDSSSSSVGVSSYTTSTIYSTATYTTTRCPTHVKNCPAHSTEVVTSVIAVSTTVCPVDPVVSSTEAHAKPTTRSRKYSTSTVYSTATYTITVKDCPPHVKDCPSRSTKTSTSLIPVSTTLCPIDEPISTGKSTTVPKPSTTAVAAVSHKKLPACHTVYTTTTVYV